MPTSGQQEHRIAVQHQDQANQGIQRLHASKFILTSLEGFREKSASLDRLEINPV